MNTQQNHRTRQRGLRITLVGLLTAGLVACGSDDNESSTAETPNVQVVGNREDATCTLRPDELISSATATAIQDALDSPVIDLGRITPDTSELAAELHLFNIEIDPLDAVKTLQGAEIVATPNYIFAFAPAWQYSPWDDPVPNDRLQPAPLSTEPAQVAVLDTGFAATAAGTSASTATTAPAGVNPTTPPGSTATAEVLDGQAAGHGTFIVNLLGQLLPNATFVAGGISSRYPGDDTYVAPNGEVVSIRDDSTVTSALAETVGAGVQYLNLSFGTYGCTSQHKADDEKMEDYLIPLGLRTALVQLGEDGSQVFAASGNEGLGPYGQYATSPDIFYPAGWAPEFDWLHSVASDPKSATETTPASDYSNRGAWVETQARGSKSVSLLPDTTEWGQEHWAAWSGTSFAAPCALAKFVASQPVGGQAVATQYFDYGSDPSTGQYMECGVNLP